MSQCTNALGVRVAAPTELPQGEKSNNGAVRRSACSVHMVKCVCMCALGPCVAVMRSCGKSKERQVNESAAMRCANQAAHNAEYGTILHPHRKQSMPRAPLAMRAHGVLFAFASW